MSQPLCSLEELESRGLLAVEAELDGGPESLLVALAGGQVRAYLNVCPHAGRRLDWAPGKFLREADQVVCAAHGASFLLADGHCTAGPCRGQALRAVKVEVVNGAVRLAASR
ncbi:MAG: Rieske 2Fe-2S domain-containing protein [Aquimonas sp.]|nr:Rieske 2Fe-2S domain-containing protein [Aquimonas sp.]